MKIEASKKGFIALRNNYLPAIIISALFILSGLCASAQVYQNDPAYGRQIARYKAIKTLMIPTFCGSPSMQSTDTTQASIAYDSCNAKFFLYNPATNAWGEITGGGGGGGGSIEYLLQAWGMKIDSSGRVYTLRVDSSAVASKSYVDNHDTAFLNKTDTTTMLLPYARKTKVEADSSLFAGQFNTLLAAKLDSVTLSTDTIYGWKNGIRSFQFKSPAFANWLTNGTKIYTNATEVGVGTNSPSSQLHIVSNGLTNTTPYSAGIALTNATAATNSIFQNSPSVSIEGRTWNSTSSQSNANIWQWYAKGYSNNSGVGNYATQMAFMDYNGAEPFTIRRTGTSYTSAFTPGGSTSNGGIEIVSNLTGGAAAINGYNQLDFVMAGTNMLSIRYQNNGIRTLYPIVIGANANPAASAILDLRATDKGVLIPRMTTSQRNAIASPAAGLLVYDTDLKGFWYYENSTWYPVSGSYSVNSTSVGLSSATLNSTYPNVPVGHRVICGSISLGGAIYTKYTENGSSDVWLMSSTPVVM